MHYSASKAGLVGLRRSLALEVAKYCMNINAVAPDPIETPGIRIDGLRTKRRRKPVPVGQEGLTA